MTDRGKIIGVTGGIACGKSTVCQLLAQKGAFVIDLDKVGHQLLQNTSSVFGQLLSTFGTTILDGNGSQNEGGLMVQRFIVILLLILMVVLAWDSVYAENKVLSAFCLRSVIKLSS